MVPRRCQSKTGVHGCRLSFAHAPRGDKSLPPAAPYVNRSRLLRPERLGFQGYPLAYAIVSLCFLAQRKPLNIFLVAFPVAVSHDRVVGGIQFGHLCAVTYAV